VRTHDDGFYERPESFAQNPKLSPRQHSSRKKENPQDIIRSKVNELIEIAEREEERLR
jgi:hypothetical protein